MRKWAPWAAVAACVAIASWSGCEVKRASQARQEALDSGVVWLARANNAVRYSTGLQLQVVLLERNIQIARDSARIERREADRLRNARRAIVPQTTVPASPPSVGDSLRATEAQLENCDAETLALRRENDVLGAALVSSQEVGRILQAGRDSAVTALSDGARIMATLREQLRKVEAPCRIGPLGCPSRKSVFLGAVVLTLLVLR